ncbi:MAG: hypothetical protein KAG45_07140 [Methyloprofundus sp.]|nr:hypothetical protein [Methyloprofundus sp.]
MTKDQKHHSNDKTYSTGYKQPPKQFQFTKGQSGNPRGRPKGSKNLATLLQTELAQTIIVQEQGQNKPIKKIEAIVKQFVMKALKGDVRSIEYLFKLIINLNNDQEPANTPSFEVDPEIMKNLFDRLSNSKDALNDK